VRLERVFPNAAMVLGVLPRALVLELGRATEAAARAVIPYLGCGDFDGVDRAAVHAMRASLATAAIDGVVAIGEGEKDRAPMLHNGERVGRGDGVAVDIAVDPVDGTRAAAGDFPGSIAAIAAAPRGTMFRPGPVAYMEKIVVPAAAASRASLDVPLEGVFRQVADDLGTSIDRLRVAVLDRPRNASYRDAIIRAGARLVSLAVADLSASVAVALGDRGLDMLVGIGGAPEAVVAAAAVAALGGGMCCRLWPRDAGEEAQARTLELPVGEALDLRRLVGDGPHAFAATGITGSELVAPIDDARSMYTVRIDTATGVDTTRLDV